MIYTYENTDKTIGINSKQTFVDALGKDEILNLKSFDEIFQKSENLVKKEYPGVTGGALSNVRGNWYEWLLAIGVLEFRRAYPNAHHLIPLPNIKQYDCARLYQTKIFQYIQDLRKKVSESADVSLITSNPDFVIIDSSINIDFPAPPQSGISDAYIEAVCRAFSQLEHRCSLDQIKGYTAVKSSLRPDRRLQIAHEGSLMKALYRHVQTREWLIDAPGIKYYAITSKATDADRNALKTVATHSITDVGSKPEAAVDDLLCVFSGPELESALKKILF